MSAVTKGQWGAQEVFVFCFSIFLLFPPCDESNYSQEHTAVFLQLVWLWGSWDLYDTPDFYSVCLCCCCVVIKSCLTLCKPLNWSPRDSSVCGIYQRRILELVAVWFSRGSSWPRDQTHLYYIDRRILYHWVTWDAQDVSQAQFK